MLYLSYRGKTPHDGKYRDSEGIRSRTRAINKEKENKIERNGKRMKGNEKRGQAVRCQKQSQWKGKGGSCWRGRDTRESGGNNLGCAEVLVQNASVQYPCEYWRGTVAARVTRRAEERESN